MSGAWAGIADSRCCLLAGSSGRAPGLSTDVASPCTWVTHGTAAEFLEGVFPKGVGGHFFKLKDSHHVATKSQSTTSPTFYRLSKSLRPVQGHDGGNYPQPLTGRSSKEFLEMESHQDSIYLVIIIIIIIIK